MKMRQLVATMAVCVGAAAFTASADLLIDAGPAATPSTFTTGNYVAGSEFTIGTATTVRALGWLDIEGNGLAFSHRVGLWSVATQALLAEATVTPTSMSVPSAQGTALWFLAGIPDLVLQPGVYRVAGEVNGDNIALAGNKIPGPGVTSITAGYVRTDFPNGGFAYPDLTFTADAVRATVSTIPSPAGLLVFAGVAVPALRRRR